MTGEVEDEIEEEDFEEDDSAVGGSVLNSAKDI